MEMNDYFIFYISTFKYRSVFKLSDFKITVFGGIIKINFNLYKKYHLSNDHQNSKDLNDITVVMMYD